MLCWVSRNSLEGPDMPSVDAHMPLANAEIAARVHEQARPRAMSGFQELTCGAGHAVG